MIIRNMEQIARMCGGRLDERSGSAVVRGVSIDSRTIAPGELFVPLAGDRFDGHDYVEAAVRAGAAGVLWREDRPVPEALRAAGTPVVRVADTLTALQRLAGAYRDELGLFVIGITGSNGKTTTKDMTHALLGTKFRTRKTEGNLNNHIGLPLTILRLGEETEAAVLEMGMSDFGEIELLASIAKPDIAVITNIGEAHLQQLGSREGIAQAKLEIAAGLKPGGLLLYNGDEPLLREGVKRTKLADGVRLETFGLGEGNDWTATDIELSAQSSAFAVRARGGALAAEAAAIGRPAVAAAGRHNVANALAAVAAALHAGVPGARIREGFASLKLTSMRIEPTRAACGAVVLNDAYNANPTSVRAAIDLVEQLQGYRRKWLVLGDMLELGPDEAALHRGIGEYVTPQKAQGLLTYGPLSRHTAEGAADAFAAAGFGDAVRHFADKSELAAWLKRRLGPDDLVLVKGSRGMKMEEVVRALEE
ncbi:UDP-N-acetylmuramoyl-tripeptide--D-alanyl-D-alanine ligase [Paenibacillus cisolokensis]|uniref:UDP-N-acetylmuramoyl-tripeptide--D-alanyl-D- alanine ligase n=1 Tax=Paenibacillus cisolokensis TaxID=1658519 RepID=UPI003D2C6D98